MGQKTAKEIRELNTREPKAWKVIDQHLRLDAKSKVTAKVRQAAAEFILKRIYPEKLVHSGDKENPLVNTTVKIVYVEHKPETQGSPECRFVNSQPVLDQ